MRHARFVPHIYAHDEHDALVLQGWGTEQDRLFQIDVVRRQASGTLAELAGSGALPSDLELRTVGVRRAAERSFARYSPAMKARLQADADGVNAWVRQSGALPAQHTALDGATIARALAFRLSFDSGPNRRYVGSRGRPCRAVCVAC